MQKSKRIKIIKEYLIEKKDIQIAELNNLIDVSESTIRRDIKDLAQEGFCVEHYGSVVLNEKNDPDILLNERLEQNLENKKLIGKKAANLVENNDFIYVDAGSTTLQMIQYITSENVTIITNGLNIALEAARNNLKVFIIGGEIKYITTAVIGENAMTDIRNYNFDKCFMGANGFNQKGFTTPDIKEGTLKKAAIMQSRKRYVLADTSKYNKTTSYRFSTLEECTLISEK
jgi:DeoR family fructose operon transcriptional repressor